MTVQHQWKPADISIEGLILASLVDGTTKGRHRKEAFVMSIEFEGAKARQGDHNMKIVRCALEQRMPKGIPYTVCRSLGIKRIYLRHISHIVEAEAHARIIYNKYRTMHEVDKYTSLLPGLTTP